MIFQRIPVPKKDGTYNYIPGLDLHYSGNFPLWRISYYLIGVMRDMFEMYGASFQPIINNIWNTRTPEDYSEYYSKVKASFKAQWFHERTIIGKQMRSLEEMMEKATEAGTSFDVADSNDYFEDASNRLSWEQFLSTLPEKDQMIIRLKVVAYVKKI